MKQKRNASLVIFTLPKSFKSKHITLIQSNAIGSWMQIEPKPRIILFGTDPSIHRFAKRYHLEYYPVRSNSRGTPYVSDAFARVQRIVKSGHFLYLNSDVVLPPTFHQVRRILPESDYLICGQRHDLELNWLLNFQSRNWWTELKSMASTKATPHPKLGSDYFIFNRGAIRPMPDFLVGRIGWDNWLLSYALKHKLLAIDGSDFIYVLHQQHDYAHLQGQSVKNDPESQENINQILIADRKIVLDDLPYYLTSEGQLMRRHHEYQKLIPRLLGLLLIVPLIFRIIQALPGVSMVFKEFVSTWADRQLDSDQQMLKYRGPSYLPLKFINQYLEVEAKIIYPKDLPDELNQVLAAYHVYPRKLLIYSTDKELDRLLTLARSDFESTYYLFFSESSFRYTLEAPLIVIFGESLNDEVTIYSDTTYKPGDSRFTDRSGVILIK